MRESGYEEYCEEKVAIENEEEKVMMRGRSWFGRRDGEGGRWERISN